MSETDFWTNDNEYQQLARQFERDVEIVHPPIAHSYCDYCPGPCTFAKTEIEYVEYRGEDLFPF